MREVESYQAPRSERLSPFEKFSFLAGAGLIGVALIVMMADRNVGGLARAIGSLGLDAIVVSVAARGAQLYRAGVPVPLPESVGTVRVRVRPARTFTAISLAVAIVLPLAALAALLAFVWWAWLPVAVVLLVGCGGLLLTRIEDGDVETYYFETPPAAAELLERLCMRADLRPPELVVEGDALATAWTARGRVHLSRRLLKLLDEAELEAVLAHEVAHLARRDAAAMEISSSPSRVLLSFVGALARNRRVVTRALLSTDPSLTYPLWIIAVLSIPPAFVIGWISRLSVLGMSRARELSADAAAAALTGRPSALASALVKLDGQRATVPSADLRQAYAADAVLRIVGTHMRGLGCLFSTHPPTAKRVRRLERLEARMQAVPAR
jgi:heat shock protein HtpX